MGHAHFGGKTLLYLLDGLYSGKHPMDPAPRRWDSEPFNGNWTSSLFASQLESSIPLSAGAKDELQSLWLNSGNKTPSSFI
jgi:hypothetical protein